MDEKVRLRKKRHVRVRSRVVGNAARPRLNIFRSLKHIYAQIIDDDTGQTLAAASTAQAWFKTTKTAGGNISAAKAVGTRIAKQASECGVTAVVYDRGGWQYHGRLKELAEAARGAGLQF